MPKVSVIIPCYNLGEYLEEAVESVLNQTYQDFEIIIVNDGSTDEFTNQLLKNAMWAKTTIYHTLNQGLPATRNYGIERSSGEYICCLDSDDKYHPEFLEKTVKVLDDDINNEYGFVTTWVQLFGNKNDIWFTTEYNIIDLLFQNNIHVASLFKKKNWEEVYGYSINLTGYQDWDFWLKIVGKGYKWHVFKECLFNYRVRDNSMINNSDQKRDLLYSQIIENNLELFENNVKLLILKIKTHLNDCYKEIINKDNYIAEKDNYITEKDNYITEIIHEIEMLNNSYEYRIGKKIMFLPKKLKALWGIIKEMKLV